MEDNVGKKKLSRNLKVEELPEGKIGSAYMVTIEGQPFLKNTVNQLNKKDIQLRPREIKE